VITSHVEPSPLFSSRSPPFSSSPSSSSSFLLREKERDEEERGGKQTKRKGDVRLLALTFSPSYPLSLLLPLLLSLALGEKEQEEEEEESGGTRQQREKGQERESNRLSRSDRRKPPAGYQIADSKTYGLQCLAEVHPGKRTRFE
jgi:hypothetical protein